MRTATGRVFPPIKEHFHNHAREILKGKEFAYWGEPFHPADHGPEGQAALTELCEEGVILMRQAPVPPGNPPYRMIMRGPNWTEER